MPTDSTTRLHLDDLARLRRAVGWVALLGPGFFGAVLLGAGLWSGLREPLASGLWFLLASGVLASLRSMLSWRERELARLAEGGGEPARVPLGTRAWPWCLAFLGLAAPLFPVWAPWLAERWEPLAPWSALRPPAAEPATATTLAWITACAAALSALLAPWLQTMPRAVAPEARGAAAWMRAGALLSLVAAALLFARAYHLPWVSPHEERAVRLLFGAVAVASAELLLRALGAAWMRFYDGHPHPGARVATGGLLLQLLASRFNPISSLFAVLAEVFGIDLKGTWALTVIRRSLLPLAAGLALVGWLATAVVMVPTTAVGVHERFGRRSETLLEPGLHFVLPWPLHRVVRVSVERVRTMPIGYLGALEGASMLWTVPHAEEEHRLLLGNGRDLVTINAELHWRVRDTVEFVYTMQNPEQALADLADRVLMTKTEGRTLDGVLSENLAVVAADFRDSIQAAADAERLGIEVVDFTLLGLHPPIEVAEDYQAVAAAQIERETQVIEGQTYGQEEVPRAEGQAATLRHQASRDGITRLARARGEAQAFETMLASYALAPDLFRLLWYLERLEDTLTGRRFHVIDQSIEADGGAIWVLE